MKAVGYFIEDLSGNFHKISLSSSSFKASKKSIFTGIARDNSQLGSYLAGLIEGDGAIIVPATLRSEKGKLLYPTIKITFVDKDTPLALKIKEVLGGGTMEYPKDVKYVNYLIQDIATLQKVTVLINGKFRTPKIEALHRLIDWFNARPNQKVPMLKLGLDTSNISNNAWLSGFLEADGNFYSSISVNSLGIANSIRYYMRISQRAEYLRKNDETQTKVSYLPIMTEIANFLSVSNVTSINRNKPNYIEKVYEVRTVKRLSCEELINYMSKYPLYSSKYLDFLDWAKIHDINKSKGYKTIEGTNRLLELKGGMNSLRSNFDWAHLDNFYKYE